MKSQNTESEQMVLNTLKGRQVCVAYLESIFQFKALLICGEDDM